MIHFYDNENGPRIGVSDTSGVQIVEHDGLKFKNHSRSGKLEKFEDWRLSAKERAADLASRLTPEQIASLMMYSGHQGVPGRPGPFCDATVNGVPFAESGAKPYDLTDQQKEWIGKNGHRHLLLADIDNAVDAITWVNRIQELCEGGEFAIPCNISSDPRHAFDSSAEYNLGSGNVVSQWPESIGLAATFDPELANKFGRVVAEEYRALGISTALGPQVDLATEPRWGRFPGTFGESPKLSAAMAKAVCEGYQTTPEKKRVVENGWGYGSINAMPKHWPSGGPEEGGRDAHFAYGKYAVYPGNNFEGQMAPFLDGAFNLSGGTGCASAVMPYYTISWEQDTKNGENVGNSYSKYIITDLLRDKYGFDGVVCTDWGVVFDPNPKVNDFARTCWGVEKLSMAERFYKAIIAGVDQFGDVTDPVWIIQAYHTGVKEYGESFMNERFRKSAERILLNMFRLGLFENPYLNAEESLKIIHCDEFVQAGEEAQKKSIILLKNRNRQYPFPKGSKVYMPKHYTPAGTDWFGDPYEESWGDMIDRSALSEYYTVVETPDDADFALVTILQPNTGGGYDEADLASGGNGYMPISLQYGEYTASSAREESIAGGDYRENFTNRSYKGKTVTAKNINDLRSVIETKKAMGNKPVVTVLQFEKPVVPAEFEPYSDVIIAHSGVGAKAFLEVLCGNFEPQGLLPCQMPANMETVEKQCEDLPFDMDCYVDADGHAYDFAYGMNFSGVITDERTVKYR